MKIKARVDTILPIVLSLALPALRLFAGTGYEGSIPLMVEWLLLSVMLFALWHFLWLLWDKPFSKKHLKKLAVAMLCLIFEMLLTKN